MKFVTGATILDMGVSHVLCAWPVTLSGVLEVEQRFVTLLSWAPENRTPYRSRARSSINAASTPQREKYCGRMWGHTWKPKSD